MNETAPPLNRRIAGEAERKAIARISIITPCRNSGRYIKDTIDSILGQRAVQSGRVELEYFVCDGASEDDTLRIVENYRSSSIHIVSEPDTGMYAALIKGLARASGDVVAYINAGDYYHPHAFDTVLDVFETSSASWLTGYNVQYNHAGAIVNVGLPFRYRRRLFECGLYATLLPIVQQESTFWRRHLNDTLDLDALARLRYAGDYYMWHTFAQHTDLHIVEAVLGGFRSHPGQLSESVDAYRSEVRGFTRAPGLIDFALAACDRLAWYAPVRVKKWLNSDGLLRFDHASQRWV